MIAVAMQRGDRAVFTVRIVQESGVRCYAHAPMRAILHRRRPRYRYSHQDAVTGDTETLIR
jgi:hypothetical protein